MNKHCFRLIFSKTLGFLIPVAEISTAQRKPGQTSSPAKAATPTEGQNWSLKALPFALLSLLPNAFADVIVEPGQQTSMSKSSNGVPVVEIADPNNKGLSHNRFNEFNVNQPGLIFNNSMRDGVSQIGGLLWSSFFGPLPRSIRPPALRIEQAAGGLRLSGNVDGCSAR